MPPYLGPCGPRCYGIGDPIHNPMFTAPHDYSSLPPAVLGPAPYHIEGEQLRSEMVTALYDVFDLVTQSALDESDRYNAALAALTEYIDALWYQRLLPVPVEVGAILSWQERYAATLTICIDILVSSQLWFDADPHPGIWRTIQNLNRQAETLLVRGDFAEPLPAVTAPAITVEAPRDEVVASSSSHPQSSQPQRPGLSILQAAESGIQREPTGMKTMTEVPTVDTTLTIGSGTDWIDHFDARHLQIVGIEAIKLMHPIAQASIAKHQAKLLQQLARKVSIGAMSNKYGPPTSVQCQAAKQTVDTTIRELHRRGVEVPQEAMILQKLRTSGLGSLPTRGMPMGDRMPFRSNIAPMPREQPTCGPMSSRQPSLASNRIPSFGPASDYGKKPARQPSYAGGRLPSFKARSLYGSQPTRQQSLAGSRAPSFQPQSGYGSSVPRQRSVPSHRAPSYAGRAASFQQSTPGSTLSNAARPGTRVSSLRPGSLAGTVPSTISDAVRSAPGAARFFRNASGYGQRMGSQAERSRSTLRVPSMSHKPSIAVPVAANYGKEVCQLGTGQLYSEWVYFGSVLEVCMNHPLTLTDLPGTLEERLIPGLKKALVDRNASLTKVDLEDLEVAKRFYARGETIKVFTAWLENDDVVKTKVAANAMADFVTTEDRNNVAERFVDQVSGAGLSATESETIADRIRGGKIDELVAEQVHKDKISSLKTSGSKSKGKGRAVSFRDYEASSSTVEQGLPADAHWSRQPEWTDHKDSTASAATVDLANDYVSAFPQASRVSTLEAAQKALAEQLSAACHDDLPQPVLEDDFVDASTPPMPQTPTTEQPTMHEELAQRAAASADSISDKAEAASDVGDLNEFDWGATSGGAKAE